MSKLFYRNFRLLILTVVLIVIWGLTSYQALPRREDPESVSRIALVKTFFPGASAERVEVLITEKIEEEISEIEEIKNYESTSRTGTSIINIELLDRVKRDEADVVWSRVRDKLRDVQPELPQGVTEPELEEAEVKAYALLAALFWEQDDLPNYAILNRRAKSLEDELRAIDGTEKVETFGAPDEEITVEVNSSDLAALGLTAQDLSRQIQQSDSKIAAGQLRSSNNDLLIEVKGELDSLERVRQIPIRCTSCASTNGDESQFTRLGDIARVEKGIVEPASDLALVGGHPAVTLAVFVEPNKRFDQWARDAYKTFNKFREQLPSGLKLQVIFDQNIYVKAQLNQLISEMLWGAVLLFGVVVFMMGWQSALVVQAALLLSILIAFGGMKVMDIPLHQTSVVGLIVASGILIDNAIIIVDETNNGLKKGLKPEAAVTKSARHLAVPLLAATLTTVLAFLPIALMPGNMGDFINSIGWNVILAVSASLLVALNITPVLVVRLQQCWQRRRAREWSVFPALAWWQTGFSHPTLTRIYRRTLDWTFARPVLAIVLCLILPVAGFFLASTLEIRFLPFADRDQAEIQLELPSSGSLEQTQTAALQVRERLMNHPAVVDVHWFIGRSAPRFYYNLITDRESQANFAHALVQLKSIPPSSLIQTLQTEMDAAFPAARVVVRQLEQSPPTVAPIEMRIYGSDIERLQELGEKARALLVQVDDVIHTRANLNEVLPQLGLHVDEEEARWARLDNTRIAQQLNNTLEGTLGGSVLESTEEMLVRVRLSNADRANLDQITSMDLLSGSPASGSGNGGSLNSTPLSALGEVQLEPELAAITRRNGQRVNTVQGFVKAGALPAKVLAKFQKQLPTNLELPSGYSFDFGGEAETRNNTVGDLFATVGVLTVLMVATLVLSLSSFRLASLIGVVAFNSIGLGFLALWLLGYPFGFSAIIGLMGMIGVAVDDSITVLSALQENLDARVGDTKAVREVVLHSTRHVLTTTFTNMFGSVPLIVGGGGFWPPLAVAIAGGVAGATLLALYLIPPAYLLLNRKKAEVFQKC